jgi:hypothetical protein
MAQGRRMYRDLGLKIGAISKDKLPTLLILTHADLEAGKASAAIAFSSRLSTHCLVRIVRHVLIGGILLDLGIPLDPDHQEDNADSRLSKKNRIKQ